MKKQIQVAQKAIVFKKKNGHIYMLLVKYDSYKYKSTSGVLSQRYGCPGGRIAFGEDLDNSLIRECFEETGVTILPGDPIGLSRWIVKKETELNDIIVVFRVCALVKEKMIKKVKDEADIENSKWADINTFDFDNLITKTELKIVKMALAIITKSH
ncbi:MAG: NUDIX hydrolase [Candidatus Dojkabacteria bacterium]|jgi:ADP-ribose pyrophosphatase YjhB (NUDIX family)|nr:NUDIX hydrolase [Candidatus Dojkabacteria bacterium]